ncbi:hypothetical protein HHK36_004755 [Tetracentron sinense]|uniref:Uncharacterized protein n=1 Tax=Tetracentron sinense TaxID=13715 RepID=A0A835DQH2_TETSI|nr:hypothetical protein HHK36_004755 [Tetracentron sinense]
MPLCSRTVKISVHPSLRGGNSSLNFRSAPSSLPQFAATISGESQVSNISVRLHPFADPRFRSRFLFSSGELPVPHSYRHLLRSVEIQQHHHLLRANSSSRSSESDSEPTVNPAPKPQPKDDPARFHEMFEVAQLFEELAVDDAVQIDYVEEEQVCTLSGASQVPSISGPLIRASSSPLVWWTDPITVEAARGMQGKKVGLVRP